MNKYFKLVTFSIIVFISIFMITGCGNKKEEKKDNSKATLEIEQTSEKSVTANISNGGKEDSLLGDLLVEDGDNISISYKMEGPSEVYVYFYKEGSDHNKNNSDYELISGVGESSMEDFPTGKYELEFVVDSDTANGTIKIEAK